MMMGIWDPHYLWYVLVPTLVLGLGAQILVKSAYARASRLRSSRGLTGAEAARAVLSGAGIESVITQGFDDGGIPGSGREGIGVVRIGETPGMLSDHYNPANRTLRLSPEVFEQPSLASVAVAAHEAGHAIQHKDHYLPLALRSGIVPLVNAGQFLSQIALMIGLLFAGGLHGTLFQIAVLGYGLVTVFSLITLPVEFNASRRALAALTSRGIITVEEEPAVRGMLRAAALTYVAAAVTAILQLLYIFALRRDE
jgi:Zn-dependent membrane protease YugP